MRSHRLVHILQKQAHKQGTFSVQMVAIPRLPLWYQTHCIPPEIRYRIWRNTVFQTGFNWLFGCIAQ